MTSDRTVSLVILLGFFTVLKTGFPPQKKFAFEKPLQIFSKFTTKTVRPRNVTSDR